MTALAITTESISTTFDNLAAQGRMRSDVPEANNVVMAGLEIIDQFSDDFKEKLRSTARSFGKPDHVDIGDKHLVSDEGGTAMYMQDVSWGDMGSMKLVMETSA